MTHARFMRTLEAVTSAMSGRQYACLRRCCCRKKLFNTGHQTQGGVPVCRGLQDELFNLTLDLVKVEAERTRAEAKLDGSIQRVQLDNQMLVC